MNRTDWYSILEYAIEHTHNIVMVYDEDHLIQWVNNSFRSNFLFTNKDVIGRHIHFLFTELPSERASSNTEWETQWKDKEGNLIWLQLNQFSTRIKDQRYTVIIGNLIAKWKTLEELSREQEILIDGFSNSFSEINVVLGHQFQVMAFNIYAQRFFRRYLDIHLQKGQNLMSLLPNWMRPYMKKQLMLALNNERIKKKRYIQHFKKWFNLGFFPITKATNEVRAVSFHAEDITNQERYLKRLRKQKNQIQKIAWNNSHDLRRPVANIVGLSDLLHNHGTVGESGFMISKIRESAMELDLKIRKLSRQLESFR